MNSKNCLYDIHDQLLEGMSESESESDTGNTLSDSMSVIHKHVEQLAHLSKHLYTRAVRVSQLVENPDLDIWTQSFVLHDRARLWAKKHLIGQKCSLWQIHETLLFSARKEGRILNGKVRLSAEEAAILELPMNEPQLVWHVLSKLPMFFHMT